MWDTYVTRSCSGSTCTSNSANEKIEDCGTDGCSNGECNEPVSCHIEVSPSLNTWNSDYVPLSDCECETDDDCRAIYRARTTSISGNTATMEFKKANSGGSMPAVHYWLAVSPENACKDLEVYSTRTDGTWSSSSTTKSFSFSVWPSQSAFENASSNESKSFFLITGGSGGYENEKLWFQRNVVTFTKICD